MILLVDIVRGYMQESIRPTCTIVPKHHAMNANRRHADKIL
jgi:hypothetical protein